MATKILVVEDDEAIRDVIRFALESNGYGDVIAAGDGESGLQLARREQPSLVLLDLMLPQLDGLSVCRELKRDKTTRNIPVIMLTAKSEESDIVRGLETGANDYVTKPFSNKVLVARIRAQLRSSSEQNSGDEIRCDALLMNTAEHTAKLGDEMLDLTATEYGILRLFAKHPGRVFTRDQIVLKVKGDDYPVTDRAIDVQIVNLRRKLGLWGAHIETVRGVGYRMKAIL